MDTIFLLFMFVGLGFALYFFIFKRFFKDALLALTVSIASFFLFGFASDLNDEYINHHQIEETTFESFHCHSRMPHQRMHRGF